MAKSCQTIVQDKIDDLTRCSICAEIYTNPKILPCVHTFCLHCLEKYGKDKRLGDRISCPICRNEFTIPDKGFCSLPNNFFIGEILEIGKLTMPRSNEATCNICPEGEELVAKMYCIDCKQVLCGRCSTSHRKSTFSQDHQVVQLGSRLNAQEFNSRNSYCEHHPKQLITMYCTDDSVAICLICCLESHQYHRCISVDKAAGDFTTRLEEDLRKVTNRLPECDVAQEKLDTYKKELMEQISKTEKNIIDTGIKFKLIVDQHTAKLVKHLTSLKQQNLKTFDITKEDIQRFRVMIDSFSGYCEEVLSRGSPVDICRAADQMHTRANELVKQPVNCSGEQFCCNKVIFRPLSFETILRNRRSDNVVGELTVTESPDQIIKFDIESRPTVTVDKGGIIQIRFELASKTLAVTLHSKTKVSELFRIACEQCCAVNNPEDFYITFKGMLLEYEDEKTLHDYDIVHQSTLRLNVRVRPGHVAIEHETIRE